MKRIRLDGFQLRKVDGIDTLFLDAKQIHPKKGRLRKKDRQQILETGLNIVKYSPQAACIPLDMEGKKLKGYVQAICEELSRLNDLKASINQRLQQMEAEPLPSQYTYFSMQAIPKGEQTTYAMNCTETFPHSRNQLQLSKTDKLAVFMVFTKTPLRYVELTSQTDLYKMYNHFLFVGKVLFTNSCTKDNIAM